LAEAALREIQAIRPAEAVKKRAFSRKSLALAKKSLPYLMLDVDMLLLHRHSVRFFRMKKEQEKRIAETGKKLEKSEEQKEAKRCID